MKTINIYKAEGIGKARVESVRINITARAPSTSFADPHWRAKAENQRDEQAQALCDIFWDALPGGVLDALLAEMMRRRASLLRVSIGETE